MHATPITPLVIQVEQLYSLREPQQVVDFLATHPYLPALLIDAHPHIQHYFPNAPCFLEVFTDPESMGHQELFVNIGTTLDAGAAFQAIRSFDHAWWLAAARRANGFLTIDVEFI